MYPFLEYDRILTICQNPDVEEMTRTLKVFNQPRERTTLANIEWGAPAPIDDVSEQSAAAPAIVPIAPIVPVAGAQPLAPVAVDKYREDDNDGFDDIDFGDDDEFDQKAAALPVCKIH